MLSQLDHTLLSPPGLIISYGEQTSVAPEAGRKPRCSGGHLTYCPAHGVSGHLHVGRLCVHTQGKSERGVESRDIAVLGTGGLLATRGTCTVLKPTRKEAFLGWVLVVSKT